MRGRLLSLVTVLASVGLLGYLVLQAWLHFGPERPRLGQLRQKVANAIITQVADDLYRSRPPNIRSVFLFQIENDSTDYVTDGLRQAITDTGVFELRDRAPGDRLRKALRLRIPSPRDYQSAVEECRRLGVDGVLVGNLLRLESHDGSARAELELTLADLSTGQPVFRRSYSKELLPETGALRAAPPNADDPIRLPGTAAQRFTGWLLFVLLLPIVTFSFARNTARKDSNQANATALAIYTLAGAATWWLSMGISFDSWPSILSAVAACAAVFFYNARMLALAVRMESE
jgi:hypothetical protein